MYNSDGETTETNLVPIASSICGTKTENSRLKLAETYEKSVASYRFFTCF
jgi:hypothetical protein